MRGYGVLQPRLAVSLVGAQQSWFARLFAGEAGLDPYTREVSNVYHDLFGQGQYVGKGIYDVEAFHNALEDRFPPNRILSHDLIEGCHVRCGFVNDVELIEDYPCSYLADSYRRHRWTRGDWQIARWVLPSVPDHQGHRVANPLGAQARWLIFDNLRRSLVPAALLATFVLGWLALPDAALRWTATLLAIYLLPNIFRTTYALLAKGKQVAWSDHVAMSLVNESRFWAVEGLEFAFLPYQACLHLDAIVRALWRLFVSGRRLLQWQTAWVTSQTVGKNLGPPLGRCGSRRPWRRPRPSPWRSAARRWAIAGPILAMWFVSPFAAWIMGRPCRPRLSGLTGEQAHFSARLPAAPGHTSSALPGRNTIGCRQTISRRFLSLKQPPAPRRPISAWDFSAPWPPMTSVTSPRAASFIARSRRWPPSTGWNGTGDISLTGTTRKPSSRSLRGTCPAWTAATWPRV